MQTNAKSWHRFLDNLTIVAGVAHRFLLAAYRLAAASASVLLLAIIV